MVDSVYIVGGDVFDILRGSIADAFGSSSEFTVQSSRPKIARISLSAIAVEIIGL